VSSDHHPAISEHAGLVIRLGNYTASAEYPANNIETKDLHTIFIIILRFRMNGNAEGLGE
jgi:hypothetical protein